MTRPQWACDDCWTPVPFETELGCAVCGKYGAEANIVPITFHTAVRLVARWDARDARKSAQST